jgi:hypothetical protein
MRKFARRAAILAAWALATFGCAKPDGAKLPAGGKLQITEQVWSDYHDYLKRGRGLGPDRRGVFGVAIIGDVGMAGLATCYYCPRMYEVCGPAGPTPSPISWRKPARECRVPDLRAQRRDHRLARSAFAEAESGSA